MYQSSLGNISHYKHLLSPVAPCGACNTEIMFDVILSVISDFISKKIQLLSSEAGGMID